jgi:hypothetical protein
MTGQSWPVISPTTEWRIRLSMATGLDCAWRRGAARQMGFAGLQPAFGAALGQRRADEIGDAEESLFRTLKYCPQ